VLNKSTLGQINEKIEYRINERYSFDILITASIDLIRLELQKSNVNIVFSDDCMEMNVKEVILVKYLLSFSLLTASRDQ